MVKTFSDLQGNMRAIQGHFGDLDDVTKGDVTEDGLTSWAHMEMDMDLARQTGGNKDETWREEYYLKKFELGVGRDSQDRHRNLQVFIWWLHSLVHFCFPCPCVCRQAQRLTHGFGFPNTVDLFVRKVGKTGTEAFMRALWCASSGVIPKCTCGGLEDFVPHSPFVWVVFSGSLLPLCCSRSAGF